MKQAMELAEKLGHPSVGTMMEFINSGTMNNLPVTAHDTARAYALADLKCYRFISMVIM